jgi:hypothetical protein
VLLAEGTAYMVVRPPISLTDTQIFALTSTFPAISFIFLDFLNYSSQVSYHLLWARPGVTQLDPPSIRGKLFSHFYFLSAGLAAVANNPITHPQSDISSREPPSEGTRSSFISQVSEIHCLIGAQGFAWLLHIFLLPTGIPGEESTAPARLPLHVVRQTITCIGAAD